MAVNVVPVKQRRTSMAEVAMFQSREEGYMVADPIVQSTGVRRVTNRVSISMYCLLCQDILVDPHTTIRCGHSMCLQCYNDWAAKIPNLKSPYPCAICSRPFAQLVPNWTMRKLIEEHVGIVEDNMTGDYMKYGVPAGGRAEYAARVAAWNAKKAETRNKYTHPTELVQLVPYDEPKDA